jgi:hypothetical protein
MNNKQAKKIRSIIPTDTPMSRRAYRRAKKLFTRLPKDAKKDFLLGLEAMIHSK